MDGQRGQHEHSRRAVVGGLSATALLTRAGASRAAKSTGTHIVVSPSAATTALADALARASRTPAPVTIALMPGIYREKLRVEVPGVTLLGLGAGAIVTYGAAAGLKRPDGTRWGTAGSSTLAIEAPGVTLRNLTVRNDFDFIADGLTHASGGAQATALSIGRGADRTRVDRCTFEGFQDTLYVHTRALFTRCTIKGGVDFIFGGAAALFQHCAIVTRHVPDRAEQGYVAAPSTLAAQRFGLVFDRCHVTREPGVPDRSTWLGRPWRAGGNMAILGAAAFLRCRLDAHIREQGWTAMGYTDPAGVRRMLTPQEARLVEWRSTGPGAASPGAERHILTADEAAAFTPSNILAGWSGDRTNNTIEMGRRA